MNAAKHSLVFNAGIPTSPDIRKLMDQWPVLSDGQRITKGEIAEVISTPSDSFRWKTVVHQWRRKLFREQNVLLKAIPRVGYEVANPDERVGLAGAKYKSGLRHVRRAGDIVTRTDTRRLSPDARRAADHLCSVTVAVAMAAATEAKRLQYSAPVKQVIG